MRKDIIAPTGGYRGVHIDKRDGRWYAGIVRDSRLISLGGYESPPEAAAVFEWVAKKLHGEFYKQQDYHDQLPPVPEKFWYHPIHNELEGG